jgi:Eco57I restriction-modification methylase
VSDLGHHGEWLSLLDVSGPFLAEPVLKEALPQGLQGLDPVIKKEVRQAYDEWREALDFDEAEFSKLHSAWISFVLERALGFSAEFLVVGDKLGDGHRYLVPENGITLVPDAAVTDGKGKSLLLVKRYDAQTSLSEAASSDGWAAGPIERMIELCRATGIRLALVTNGEQWTLIDAPVGAVTSTASWYARLWSQEPLTLQAFAELLGIRRFFSGAEAELTTLLDKSLTLQDEVTDALGEQVRRAVEVLVQSLDRADQDRNRELLKDVSPEELYEAGLTIMMRIVFLLSAEERGLLLLGDRQYEDNYAVSTLRGQLRLEADEVQERRWDAWSRLLSLFRAVFAGVDHGSMRMPALGGSLFDPDRFPFLEGRSKGSNWKTDAAVPLPIDNRTVLLLLDAVQLFQGRTLSYLALDVEQIGYVYEGLLERTVIRASEVTLDLTATKNAKAPWVTLSELDDAAANAAGAVEELLKERTGSSASRIRNDLAKKPDETESGKLLAACDGDVGLRDRIKPYFHLLRTDSWGYPLVYPKGTFMVASGFDRRETGTHYTPKSFTEAIVRTTLEPLVYVGPSDGAPRDEWRLKSPDELLDLKVCDPAMGSGAFLVQVCRYLADRVVEAWAEVEKNGKAISADGEVKDDIGALEPLSPSADERSLTARRLIAERCLYGVDMNPLAVELAKLSIWLVTLAKGRPFGFLDHNLRSGDSLLGITDINQAYFLQMKPSGTSSKKLFAAELEGAITEAIRLRLVLRGRPIRDIADVQVMEELEREARTKLTLPILVSNAMLGSYLADGADSFEHSALLAISVGEALNDKTNRLPELEATARRNLDVGLPDGKARRRPFHWPLEFPEVFEGGKRGFDAFVGNPPFLGNRIISGVFGMNYKSYLANNLALSANAATADLVVFFFLKMIGLLKSTGYMGFLARRSLAEGRNREVGLERILGTGATIYFARTDMPWPGKASVVVHQIHLAKSAWDGCVLLNGEQRDLITAYLDATSLSAPRKLHENKGRMFQGTILNGEGFKLSAAKAAQLLSERADYANVVFPFIGGNEINSDAFQNPSSWVISFWDWQESRAKEYSTAYSLVEQNVKPERQRKKLDGTFQLRKPLPERWWHHADKRPALYHALGRGDVFEAHPNNWKPTKPLSRVLAVSRGATKYPAFTFLENRFVFSEKLYVMAADSNSIFAVLSSDMHSVWARMQKTSMGADLFSLSYTHGDIFETYPFPEGVLDERHEALEAVGKHFFQLRQEHMESNEQGLTKFYNDFHNPQKTSAPLRRLRVAQSDINQTVANAYGWNDLDVTTDFEQVAYLPAGENLRFTIKEEIRLDVLRRLSMLNATRSAKQTAVASDVEEAEVSAPFELKMENDAVSPPGRKRRRR